MAEIDRRIPGGIESPRVDGDPALSNTAAGKVMAELAALKNSCCLGWSLLMSKIPTTAGIDTYVYDHKVKFMYGPVFIVSYISFWMFYDRSDVRRFELANTATIEQGALGT